MGPISKGPSGRNLSSEEKEKLLRQLQEIERQGSSSSPIGMSGRSLSSFDVGKSFPHLQEGGRQDLTSSPVGMSGRSLSSFDVGKSFPIGMGGAPYGMGVPAYSRPRSRVWWIVGIVVAAVVIAGVWFLVRRFV